MKKILFIILLIFIFPFKVLWLYLFLPSDFIVGKIENIWYHLDENYSKKVKLENYIHNKLPGIDNFISYDLPIDYSISITNYFEGLNIEKWDIVILSPTYSEKYSTSHSINKVTCYEWEVIITSNSIFGLSENNVNKIKDSIYYEIWCDNLYTFFEKDRRFEDLQWTNLKIYFYWILWFFIFILWIIWFFIFRKN